MSRSKLVAHTMLLSNALHDLFYGLLQMIETSSWMLEKFYTIISERFHTINDDKASLLICGRSPKICNQSLS